MLQQPERGNDVADPNERFNQAGSDDEGGQEGDQEQAGEDSEDEEAEGAREEGQGQAQDLGYRRGSRALVWI